MCTCAFNWLLLVCLSWFICCSDWNVAGQLFDGVGSHTGVLHVMRTCMELSVYSMNNTWSSAEQLWIIFLLLLFIHLLLLLLSITSPQLQPQLSQLLQLISQGMDDQSSKRVPYYAIKWVLLSSTYTYTCVYSLIIKYCDEIWPCCCFLPLSLPPSLPPFLLPPFLPPTFLPPSFPSSSLPFFLPHFLPPSFFLLSLLSLLVHTGHWHML